MEMRNWGLGFPMGPTRVPIEFEARVPKEEKGTRASGGGGFSNNLSSRRDFSFRQGFSGNSNSFEWLEIPTGGRGPAELTGKSPSS
jgi:hypothetical protein